MRQGGVTPTFTPRIDAALGRVDIAISRPATRPARRARGCSRRMLFDAVAPGSSQVTATAVDAERRRRQPMPVTRRAGHGDGEMSAVQVTMRMFRKSVRRLHVHRALVVTT